MSEQITLYDDITGTAAFDYRVKIALEEVGAKYKSYGIDLRDKPEWFAKQLNPWTGRVPVITYGGPDVPPDEPSALSFKLPDSDVILEFLADLFPNSGLLPPVSNPTARARVRFFISIVALSLVPPGFEVGARVPGALERLVKGLDEIQALLPDPDAPDGGEYAIGKEFTIADCDLLPLLVFIHVTVKADVWTWEPDTGKKLEAILAEPKFDRLRRYQKVLLERESVKKVIDFELLVAKWKKVFSPK